MLKQIDTFLNSITMYSLVLRGLLVMAAYAIVLGFLGLLSFNGFSLVYSFLILCFTAYFSNLLFGKIFKAPVNVESAAITALILFFIVLPPASWFEALMLVVMAVVAMASKYLLAKNGRHIFNPVAIALVIMGLFGQGIGVWWVGTLMMLPGTFILGILIVRKVRKFQMVLGFLAASLLTTVIVGITSQHPGGVSDLLLQSLVSWPLIFLGSVMLTEPFTLPPRKREQILYGVFVGVVSNIPFAFSKVYSTPELALVLGNIASYAVSLKRRLLLTLVEKKQIAKEIFEFSFKSNHSFAHIAGQYLEWTLPHDVPDARGVRRYFTIASSPEEGTVKLGVKIGEASSSFKKKLSSLNPGDVVYAGQLAGDFVLPENGNEKLVFVAGGIGVTPFRSMIQSLVLKGEKRDVTLIYSVKTEDEIAYTDIWREAESVGLKFIPLTGVFLDEKFVSENTPHYKESRFYLSGPNAMVENYKGLLKKMGVKRIMTDYFPGF